MTDQPKPRLRGPLNPAEYQGLTYLSDASSRIALDLNSDLLNALAEVERLRNELATTSKGSMTVERMQEQLAELTRERDGSFEQVIVNSERYTADREKWRSQLLASAAENVRMKSALKYVSSHRGPETDSTRMADKALSSTPTALVGAIEELREVVSLIRDDRPAHNPGCTCRGCRAPNALAAYDDALGKL